ncbi:hypothetical protein E7Z59_10725 [Robertkochia marina]|uniref:Uncharacterized protein n=1 Tax=Robertkochia marina TaxID=1227945 RepID=A0A4S3LYQ8_9FLAO|nr:hypothetical protein [Robertkochia marina]THD66281.1 hypothetical protein E7Z59_10725 [Robertkochia marina]TRZ41202.1 hypothetical protein D3A96_13600 [Robertkochia marina]
MPYFELKKGATEFPPAHFADIDGLVAVGGDIDADILLKAYNNGLYYWHHPMKHIKWWSPDPRMVLQLPVESPQPELRTVRPTLKVTPTEDAENLLRHLQTVVNIKEKMDSQWLSERMFRIFSELQQRNYLKLFAIREEGKLIGGLFGTAIGRIFFGEYIWAPDSEAMALGIYTLADHCNKNGFKLIDMQKPTFQSPEVPCDEISRLSYVDYCKMNAITNHP